MTFAELLSPDLVAALEKQQITTPTPIQVAAIATVKEGKSAYLRAETGTGKTLAYLLPLLERIDAALVGTQVVIAAPTHELAIQIHRQSCELAVNAGRPIRSVLLIGGTAVDRQIDKLKAKPHVVIGSPGRMNELIGRGKLKLAHVKSVVIDEADRLLDHEGVDAIRMLFKAAPAEAQRLFVSATIDAQTRSTLAELAPDAEMIAAAAAPVNANIEHLYLVCEERDKPDVLRKLVHAMDVERAIVFVHKNDVAARVASRLAYHSIAAADLYAALDKLERKRAMDGIRSGAIRVLISSDLAARGIDIGGVSHVFNLDAPTLSQAYLHRVGRTARAGATGVAVSLFTEVEARLARRYQDELGIEMQQVRVREGQVRAVRQFPREREAD